MGRREPCSNEGEAVAVDSIKDMKCFKCICQVRKYSIRIFFLLLFKETCGLLIVILHFTLADNKTIKTSLRKTKHSIEINPNCMCDKCMCDVYGDIHDNLLFFCVSSTSLFLSICLLLSLFSSFNSFLNFISIAFRWQDKYLAPNEYVICCTALAVG